MAKNWKIRKDLSIEVCGHTLFRIECTQDFKEIKAGTLGGFIEKEENLDGNAWVSGNAKVYGNALVSDDAQVYGNAKVYGKAWVSDDAQVYGDAKVYDNAKVYGDAQVSDDAQVYDNAWVYGSACVYGDARVYGNARVYGEAWVSGDAQVSGNAWVYGEACVYGEARVSGNARVYGDEIKSKNDICYISNRYYNITITPLHIKIGCHYHAHEAWWNFTDEQIEKMDGYDAINFWRIWKEPLKQICDAMKKEKGEKDVK